MVKIFDHGNYGYAISESARRWGLDEKAMRDHVEQNYEELGCHPICVLCDIGYGNSCSERPPCDGSGLMQHCNGFRLSRETIEEFTLE